MENLLVGHYGHMSILCKYVDNQLVTLCAYEHQLGYKYRVVSKDFDSFLEESFPGLAELAMMDIIKHHKVNDVMMDAEQLVAIMNKRIQADDINFAYFALTNDDHSFIMYGHEDLCYVTFFDRELNIGSTFKREGIFIEFPTYAADVSRFAIPLLKLSDEECLNATKVQETINTAVGRQVLVV